MADSADGLQKKLSTLSNADVAGQICACLGELQTANPSLHDRLTSLLHQLSEVKPGVINYNRSAAHVLLHQAECKQTIGQHTCSIDKDSNYVGGASELKQEASTPVLDPSSVLTTLPGMSCASPRSGSYHHGPGSKCLKTANHLHLTALQCP